MIQSELDKSDKSPEAAENKLLKAIDICSIHFPDSLFYAFVLCSLGMLFSLLLIFQGVSASLLNSSP